MSESQPHPVIGPDHEPAGSDFAPEPADTGHEAEDVGGEVSEGSANEEALRRRAEALEQVRTWGDPVLKSRASEVTRFGSELEREAERMVSLMRDAMGVGLAATQLGVMQRMFVFAVGPDATPTAVANPEIEWVSEEVASAEEGCLSLPGIAVDVERPLYARVRGQDTSGEPLTLESAGLEARVLQHEIDHLDGVLMLDRTQREQRKGALRALREGESYAPPVPDYDEIEEPDGDSG